MDDESLPGDLLPDSPTAGMTMDDEALPGDILPDPPTAGRTMDDEALLGDLFADFPATSPTIPPTQRAAARGYINPLDANAPTNIPARHWPEYPQNITSFLDLGDEGVTNSLPHLRSSIFAYGPDSRTNVEWGPERYPQHAGPPRPERNASELLPSDNVATTEEPDITIPSPNQFEVNPPPRHFGPGFLPPQSNVDPSGYQATAEEPDITIPSTGQSETNPPPGHSGPGFLPPQSSVDLGGYQAPATQPQPYSADQLPHRPVNPFLAEFGRYSELGEYYNRMHPYHGSYGPESRAQNEYHGPANPHDEYFDRYSRTRSGPTNRNSRDPHQSRAAQNSHEEFQDPSHYKTESNHGYQNMVTGSAQGVTLPGQNLRGQARRRAMSHFLYGPYGRPVDAETKNPPGTENSTSAGSNSQRPTMPPVMPRNNHRTIRGRGDGNRGRNSARKRHDN